MHCFLFAGESSGDLHGSELIRALRNQHETISFSGVGGPLMRRHDFRCIVPTEEFRVMGFSDVFRNLPRLYRLFVRIRNHILKENPDAVILIDYPGFNLRLARSLRRKGYTRKIVQYICPTVWAHGKQRIDVLSKNYDLLLVIYPFETTYFTGSPLTVKYIGNPVEENIRVASVDKNPDSTFPGPSSRHLTALFPGSRPGEIERHFPEQLEAAALLKKVRPEIVFAVVYPQDSLKESLLRHIGRSSLSLDRDIFVISGRHSRQVMESCRSALAKSGTVTLELALHGVPTVVHYRLTRLNRLIAKYILGLCLPYYCIVNILKNRPVFPEHIERNYTAKDLYLSMKELHDNPDKRKAIKAECESIKETLGTHSTHKNAASAILELFR